MPHEKHCPWSVTEIVDATGNCLCCKAIRAAITEAGAVERGKWEIAQLHTIENGESIEICVRARDQFLVYEGVLNRFASPLQRYSPEQAAAIRKGKHE